MKTETAGEPGKDGSAPSASPREPAAQAKKPAPGDWAVTVGPDAPPKQPEKPARGDWAVAVTPEQPAAHKPLAKRAPAVLHKRPAASHAPADEAHPPESRSAKLDKIMAPPPSGSKLAPLALGVVLALMIGAGVANHLSKKKAAEQRAAQALATVTGFITHLEDLSRQADPFQKQLDGTISELQSLIDASAPNKDFPQRINSAITTVAKVESAVFGAEADEEQARQALAALAQRPDYQALSEKLSAAVAGYKGQQKAVDGKCQKTRALIQSARQRAPR